MTADRRAALVERMIQVLIAGPNKPHYSRDEAEAKTRATASAALDLALEEAAKVADRYEIPMAETSASHIAAAIRALKGKP